MWMSVKNQQCLHASSSVSILLAPSAALATQDTSWWDIAAWVSVTL